MEPCGVAPDAACWTPQACGAVVQPVNEATDAPEPKGGLIPQGSYVLMAEIQHTGPGGATGPLDPSSFPPVRSTWAFQPGQQFARTVSYFLDCEENFRVDIATYVLESDQVLATPACPAGEPVNSGDHYTMFDNGELHVFPSYLNNYRQVWKLSP